MRKVDDRILDLYSRAVEYAPIKDGLESYRELNGLNGEFYGLYEECSEGIQMMALLFVKAQIDAMYCGIGVKIISVGEKEADMRKDRILEEINRIIVMLLGKAETNDIKRAFATWFVMSDEELLKKYTKEQLLYRLERLKQLQFDVWNV